MENGTPVRTAAKGEVRRNGRGLKQIRTIRCETGTLDRADGSATWTQEGTEIVVGVYGPRQTTTFSEDAEKATVTVSYKAKSGQTGTREAFLESILQQTVAGVAIRSLHPRTTISIYIQCGRIYWMETISSQFVFEMENNEVLEDGGALAAAFNAVNAALVDAGIPLRSVFGAAACVKNSQGQIIIDPDASEEQEAQAMVTACFALTPNVEADAQGPPLLSSHSHGSSMTVEDYMFLKLLCYKVSEKAGELFKISMTSAIR